MPGTSSHLVSLCMIADCVACATRDECLCDNFFPSVCPQEITVCLLLAKYSDSGRADVGDSNWVGMQMLRDVHVRELARKIFRDLVDKHVDRCRSWGADKGGVGSRARTRARARSRARRRRRRTARRTRGCVYHTPQSIHVSVRPRFASPNDNTVISVSVGPGPK